MSALNKVSAALYRAARISRDVNAVTRGPAAIGRRIIRKQATKHTNRVLAGWLRALLGK